MENFDDEILLRAAYVFGILKPPVKCYKVAEIEVAYFVGVYEELTGEEIPGSQGLTSERAKQTICQFMIDSLADDILQLPLDHITGKGIADKDRRMLRDLLDIFIQLIEVSDAESDTCTIYDEGVGKEVPPRIRTALKEIQVGTNHLIGTLSHIQRFTSSVPICKQTIQTQTTPRQMISSINSPISWSKVLSRYNGHKDYQEGSRRKPLLSVQNIRPKPVISTKCKKSSPVSLKAKQSYTNGEAKRKMKSLEEELNTVKSRRKEILVLMKQLQDEDKRLKMLESILIKDIKFSNPKPAISSKQKSRGVRPITIR